MKVGRLAMVFIFFTHSLMANQCLSFFSEPTTIQQRFQKIFASRSSDFIVLVIDDFLNTEISDLVKDYNNRTSTLELKGTDSKLQSHLTTFEVYVKTIGEKANEMNHRLAPSRIRKAFTSAKTIHEKMEKTAEEFAECRTKMDACAARLQSETENAAKTITDLRTLTKKISDKIEELHTFAEYLDQELMTIDPLSANAHIFVTQQIDRLRGLLTVSKGIVALQADLITRARYSLRFEIPSRDQKIEDLIAAGAPDLIAKPFERLTVQNSSHDEVLKSPFEQVRLVVNGPLDKKGKLSVIYKIVQEIPEFTVVQANKIFAIIPNEQNWGEAGKNESSFYRDLNKISTNDFYPLSLLIAYEVAIKTSPSGNKRDDATFINGISKVLNKDAKDATNDYKNAVHDLTFRLITKFNNKPIKN